MTLRRASAVLLGVLLGLAMWRFLPPPPAPPPPSSAPPIRRAPPAETSAAGRPALIFYAVPDCPGCAPVRSLVERLAAEEPAATVACRDAFSEEGEAAIEKYLREQDHGTIAYDASGRAVWKAEGHRLTRETLLAGLRAARAAGR